METGIVTEEWVVSGRQSSLYFCICILSKFISKLLSVLFVCRSKTLLELKNFLSFIFKLLLHWCIVISHSPSNIGS